MSTPTFEEKVKKLSEPLDISSIEFRVQSVSYSEKSGAPSAYVTVLAYKDARVDMQRLDDTVGPMNWKREHLRDNKNCVVSIWNPEIKQWVSKEDTGTESNTEKEKGLASDSFKRACFNWGIGRELYDYPRIFFQIFPEEFTTYPDPNNAQKKKAKGTFYLNVREWKWEVDMDNAKVKKLTAIDKKGRLRFDSSKDFNGLPSSETPPPPPAQPKQEKPKAGQKATASGKPKLKKATYEKALKSTKVDVLTEALTKYDLTPDQIKGISGRIEQLNK